MDWIEQYYIEPNEINYIAPIVICKVGNNPVIDQDVLKAFDRFNSSNKNNCAKLKYIEYKVQGDDLIFEEVSY